MIGLPCGEEIVTIVLNCFDTIPERDGQTDGQAERRTDPQTKLLYQ